MIHIINFDINRRAVRKAKKRLKKEEQLKICLRAEICPICIGKLQVRKASMQIIYRCINCGFTFEKGD